MKKTYRRNHYSKALIFISPKPSPKKKFPKENIQSKILTLNPAKTHCYTVFKNRKHKN